MIMSFLLLWCFFSVLLVPVALDPEGVVIHRATPSGAVLFQEMSSGMEWRTVPGLKTA